APLAFTTNLEFKYGLVACYFLAVVVVTRDEALTWFKGNSRRGWAYGLVALVGFMALLRTHDGLSLGRVVHSARSFYGTLCVDELNAADESQQGFALRHGRVMHGLQFTSPERRRQPTTYYCPDSGVGIAVANHPRGLNLRIGVVGLGVGTIAAYGEPGDYLRFYEINPQVIDAAREHFTFLSDCPATVDVILGDARLSMEREPAQRFDVLVLDAFSGDAIPTHLLTEEAFAIYLRHLSDDGILALHITNRHVDLNPVVRGLAQHYRLETLDIETKVDLEQGVAASAWAILTRNREFLADRAVQEAAGASRQQYAAAPYPLWRDDFSNLLEVLR
ncbi:MAG: fused MFS/spermidine synthase, partial [Pirellulales bacterium]